MGVRGRLYRELAEIRLRLGMPIILVTHDLDEAMMLADRMCLFATRRHPANWATAGDHEQTCDRRSE